MSWAQGALATLTPMLTPYGRASVKYANGSQAGSQAKTAFNSRVAASQTNGSGPNVAPISAPWSFQGFALGLKDLGPTPGGTTRGGAARWKSILLVLGLVLAVFLVWRWLRK